MMVTLDVLFGECDWRVCFWGIFEGCVWRDLCIIMCFTKGLFERYI